jgi:hypothetical protein
MTSDEPLGFEPLDGGELNDGDYTLKEKGIWIESHPFSVRISHGDQGLSVDIYPNGREMEGAIASTYALTQDAIGDIDQDGNVCSQK